MREEGTEREERGMEWKEGGRIYFFIFFLIEKFIFIFDIISMIIFVIILSTTIFHNYQNNSSGDGCTYSVRADKTDKS